MQCSSRSSLDYRPGRVDRVQTRVYNLQRHKTKQYEGNRVSILVDKAGKQNAIVGLYDASGRKVPDATVTIDISNVGPAMGIFPSTVNLSEGDYFLAWGTDIGCGAELRSIGAAAIDALNLLNASGAPLMGTARWVGSTLPDVLGVITPNSPSSVYTPNSKYGPTYAPILAYLKA
jgi:hypothetical protein